jgi:hypothetical protein
LGKSKELIKKLLSANEYEAVDLREVWKQEGGNVGYVNNIKQIENNKDIFDFTTLINIRNNTNDTSNDIFTKQLYLNIEFLKNICSNIYNSETVLQLYTLMIDIRKEGELKNINRDIFKLLFFEIKKEYDVLLIGNNSTFTNILINDQINNDTLLYKTIYKDSDDKKYISCYRLISQLELSILLNANIKPLADTHELINLLQAIFIEILNQSKILKEYIVQPNIINTIKQLYLEVLSKINPVLIYVKERCDTSLSNPRYEIGITPNNYEYYDFKIKYYNNPFKVGCFNMKYKSIDTIHTHDEGNYEQLKKPLDTTTKIKYCYPVYSDLKTIPPTPGKNGEKGRDFLTIDKIKKYKKLYMEGKIVTPVPAYFQTTLHICTFTNNKEDFVNTMESKTYYNIYKAKYELGVTKEVQNKHVEDTFLENKVGASSYFPHESNIKNYCRHNFINYFKGAFYGHDDKKKYSSFTKKETYYQGLINGYYNKDDKNSQSDINVIVDPHGGQKIIDKINKNENIIILGYGQSGSGKTSTLIYNTFTKKEGIIPQILNKLNNVTKIVLEFVDIYLNWSDIDNYKKITRDNYMLKKIGEDTVTFSKQGDVWKNNGETMGIYINKQFNLREIEPTENNPNSSRSHVLIHIKIYKNDNKYTSMVIGDLAGVENKFTCAPSRILILDDIYRTQSDKYKDNPEKFYFDNFLCNVNEYQNPKQDNFFNTTQPKEKTITFKRTNIIKNCYKLYGQYVNRYQGSKSVISDFTYTSSNENPSDETSLYYCMKDEEEKKSALTLCLTHKDKKGKIKHNKLSINFIEYYKISDADNINTINSSMIGKLNELFKIYEDHKQKILNPGVIFYGVTISMLALYGYKKGPYKMTKYDINTKKYEIGQPPTIYKYILNYMADEEVAEGNLLVNIFENGLLKLMEQTRNDIIRYNVLYFNCELRRSEGYFINSSLISMRRVISNLILKNVQTKYKKINKLLIDANPNIINYLGPSYPNCYNNNYLYDNYDKKNIDINPKFNNNNTKGIVQDYETGGNSDEGEIIFRLIFTNDILDDKTISGEKSQNITKQIKGFGLDSTNTSLIIMTVINITDGNIVSESKSDYIIDPDNFINIPYTSENVQEGFKYHAEAPKIENSNTGKKLINNEPNPPYINLNKLKIAYNISEYLDSISKYFNTDKNIANKADIKIMSELVEDIQTKFTMYKKNFLARIKLYSFYKNDENLLKIIDTHKFMLIFDDGNRTIVANPDAILKVINYIEANNDTTLIGTTTFFNFTQISNDKKQYPLCDGDNDEMNNNNVITQPNLLKQFVETMFNGDLKNL